MSRLPHFCSDSNFHCDEESSQSMSQVRARPAICLDKSLSFISTTSVPAGTISGPASPLLGALGSDSANGACSSSSAVASPKLFHTRDVNVEASRQRSLQSFKTSRSRAISGSRTAHSSSRPYSQQPPPHHKRHHYPHPRSSCSSSVSRSCRVHSEARRGERSRCLAVEACCGILEVGDSEATALARPSDPRPDVSDAEREPGVLNQRVMSATVSPAPRHAAALSEDLEGLFSMPASEGEEEETRGGGGHCAARSHGRGRSSFNSDVREQEDADCVKRTSGATPPPRRALVLSHGCSDADTDTDARAADAQPPRCADEALERCASTCMAPVNFPVDAPRGSAILVVGSGDEDEGRAFTDDRSITAIISPANVRPLAAADASRAEGSAVSSTLPVGRLFSSGGEGEGKDAPHGAALTAHRAAATESESVNSCSRSRRSESGDMTCQLPRPVPPSATVTAACPLSSPAHAREDEGAEEARAVCEEAIMVNEQQQQQQAGTETALTNKAVNASVHTTTITAEAAANTAQDLVSFSMDSGLLPASSTLQCALQATPTIPAQPDAPAALTAAANGESASVTPLSSLMMLNSISGPSLTAATTAASSLWLVSGSTPTPLRRLRDRGREVSATLDVEEGEVEEVSRGSATARAHTERALNPEGGASSAAVAAPETGSELDRGVNRRSAPADNSTGAKQPIATAEEAHLYCRTSASPYTGAHSLASPLVSTPSFSPEPARPQAEAHHPSKLCLAARTTVSVSVQLNPLTANDDAVTSAAPQPLPAPGATTAPHRYSTATHSPFATAGTCRAPVEAAPLISSPSSAESARVSEEVKELVRRAQAEVCRTRESLISALRDHRVSFHLSEPSPTAKSVPSPTAPAHLAESSVALPIALCASPNVSPAPARRLLLPTVAVTPAEPSMPSSAAPTTVSAPAVRTSGEWRSAATVLRPQLRAAADAILRRLQGYDLRDHGVLPMDTVVRVTYFVITRRQMPPAAWSLRTAEGALATTPMQVSMVASGGDVTFRSERAQLPSHNAEGRRVALVSGTPLGCQLSSSAAGKSRRCAVTLSPTTFQTPCQQRFSLNAHDTVKHLSGSDSSVPLSRPVDRTQPRGCSRCAADANHRCKIVAAEHHGGPVTCTSPSRTLEHVMLLQQRRAEEELHLHFYFTVLEAFKQVFGERYAWRHLGATNASRHDGATNLTQPPQKRQRTSDSPVPGSSDRRGHTDLTRGEADAEHVPLEVTNEFNDVAGPLEVLFPRLRQQYALIQREKRDTAATTPSSVEGGTGDPLTTPRTTAECARSEAGAASMSPTHRPPPLDVLVYYRTYIESLREL
ncbi:hypothetical protein JIQ42_07299 [Leishmania sp. Namibia]|uniref:hypothetical protein n=1 Tax=Leishmania sp. Namibia TaxID=2802991 RepID=UPI001B5B08B1|nr:hypothetical protein JIQ42_07299 [Leishmania sp. Namibia]